MLSFNVDCECFALMLLVKLAPVSQVLIRHRDILGVLIYKDCSQRLSAIQIRHTPRTPHMQKTLDDIAQNYLGVETLKTRNRDALDFHDLAVWNIKRALKAAYVAGRKHSKR